MFREHSVEIWNECIHTVKEGDNTGVVCYHSQNIDNLLHHTVFLRHPVCNGWCVYQEQKRDFFPISFWCDNLQLTIPAIQVITSKHG